MESANPGAEQLMEALVDHERVLHPGLPGLLAERLSGLDPVTMDAKRTQELLGSVAAVLNNTCAGRMPAEYAGAQQAALEDCVSLAGTMVSWMAQGGPPGVASTSPAACLSLKEFVSAALDLASHAFFSLEWYEQLGPSQYGQAGNAVRGYVKDLAPLALDATEACWKAVEQKRSSGDPAGGELLEACRALFEALFEGLRHLGIASAARINDPAVPREMRSFAGLNILWSSLSRVMTALPGEALQQLLSDSAVQSVLRALLGCLVAEVRALVAALGLPAEYETRYKVSRFWLQHAARVTQSHPAAAAACWDDLAAAAAHVYGLAADCARASAAAAAASPCPASAGAGPGAQGQEQLVSRPRQAAQDLESAVGGKLASLLVVVMDAGGGGAGSGSGADCPMAEGQQGAAPAAAFASPHQLQARLAALQALATGRPPASGSAASASAATAGPAPTPAGAVLLCAALLQRSAHVSPEARALMATRLLPWVGCSVAVELYGMALEHSATSVDLTHTLAAAALALLLACAEQHNGQDAATFAATCGVVCNWGACAHPLLAGVAADVLSTLVQRAEPALASRLIAAVARLAALAGATEAAAAAAAVVCGGGGGGEGAAGGCSGWSGGAGGTQRLQRLLACMLAAAAPQAAPAWREALDRHPPPDPQRPHVPTDVCGAAAARVLWGAAAAAAAAQAAAARGGGAACEGEPPAGVSEQELGARAQQLLTAVRQAYAVMSSCSGGASGPVLSCSVAAAAALARHWLVQLLGCLEATVAHARHLGAHALEGLVAEAAALAAEVLPALCPSTFTGAPSLAAPASAAGAPAAAGHAAARLLARAGDLLPPGAASALAPSLLRLAEQGTAAAAAGVAAAAAHCNCPPQEELFHGLLRSQHPTVQHAAMQSLLSVSRTAPQQYAAGIRRLFPPEAPPPQQQQQQQRAGAGPPHAQSGQPPQAPGAPPPYLAGVFKSYVARRLGDAEEEAAAAAARRGRAGEGARLEWAARAACEPEARAGPAPGSGRVGAPLEARRAVQQGVEAMRVCLEELALSRSASGGQQAAEADPMDTAAGQGPYTAAREAPFAAPPAHFPGPAGPPPPESALGTGPLSSVVADDNAAMAGLSAALGTLERSLGALTASVRGQGISARRPSEWEQLQVHARAMLGDLSSATARVRSMSELMYALQGR